MRALGNGNRMLFESRTATLQYDVAISAPAGQRITAGQRPAGQYGSPSSWGINVSGNGKVCGTTHGSVNIKQITLAPDGTPLRADVSFLQYCDDEPEPFGPSITTGEVRWRVAADVTPPAAARSFIAAGQGATRTMSWTNPSADFSYTVVRLYVGSQPGPAERGYAVYSGTGHVATVGGLIPGQKYTLAAYTVDLAGNIGAVTKIDTVG
jgi:hypothetical protein